MRHKRGLTADGGYRLPVELLNRLLLQSGVMVSLRVWLLW